MKKYFQYRYLLITLFVLAEYFFYIYSYNKLPSDESIWNEDEKGFFVKNIFPNTEADKSGLKAGDRILSINNKKVVMLWNWNILSSFKVGDVVKYKIERNGIILFKKIKLTSEWKRNEAFYYFYYFLIAFVIAIGIFILFKKQNDKSSLIFFIFSHVFAVCLNSIFYISDEFSIPRNIIFLIVYPFLGTVLIHFFFCFPEDKTTNKKIRFIIKLLYAVSVMFSIYLVVRFIKLHNNINLENDLALMNAAFYSLNWMSITLALSMIVSIYNFFTIKEIISHNQLRWIMIGVIFGLLPETIFGFFPYLFNVLSIDNPLFLPTMWIIGSVILLVSLSFAIIKYRIWDIEIIIKRGLLYSLVTIFLVGFYLLLISLADFFLRQVTSVTRIISITFVAFLFVPSREFFQKRIDKLFHCEPYNSTEAAINFEYNLVGKYDTDVLLKEISNQLDAIFHFKSFIIFLVKDKMLVPVESTFINKLKFNSPNKIELPASLEEKLKYDFPFAVKELINNSKELIELKFQLIVPIIFEKTIIGCYVCGEKMSERIFSNEDITLLKLLANRSATILKMSSLYYLELERRDLLEKERSRISKDMHDEVGSSLTKIAILSELAQREIDDKNKSKMNINKISSTAREVIDSISEIIWTINPKNDTLENLASYLREYIYEILDLASIKCSLIFTENIPSRFLSAEVRRNIFLVIKESINNIVKHSKASEVKFQFSIKNNFLEIIIEDNGIGFEMNETNPFGNGLTNMNKRIEDINGTIIISSKTGTGTKINFMVELN